MYTALITSFLLLSVKNKKIIIKLSLSVSKQCYRTHFFIYTYANNTLIKNKEMILHYFKYSCIFTVRGKFFKMLYFKTFKSCFYSSTY